MGEVSSPDSHKQAQFRIGLRAGICKLGFKEVLRGLTGYVTPIFARKAVVIMGATNRILAKRVDKLTEALADVRAHAEEVKEAEDMAEVTDTVDEIIDDINEVIGPEEDEEDSGEEESEVESEEKYASED